MPVSTYFATSRLEYCMWIILIFDLGAGMKVWGVGVLL